MDDESVVDSSCNLNLETSLTLMNSEVSFFTLVVSDHGKRAVSIGASSLFKKKIFFKGYSEHGEKKIHPIKIVHLIHEHKLSETVLISV